MLKQEQFYTASLSGQESPAYLSPSEHRRTALFVRNPANQDLTQRRPARYEKFRPLRVGPVKRHAQDNERRLNGNEEAPWGC